LKLKKSLILFRNSGIFIKQTIDMTKEEFYEELLTDDNFIKFLYEQKQLRIRLMEEELQSQITDGEVIEVEPAIEKRIEE
jgi:hypothetical protein